MMKKALFLAIVCMASLPFWAGGAWGVDFCVDNATDLQTALTTAASNGTGGTIKVVQGTYTGNFIYYSFKGYSISLRGGYTAGCASRVVNPANTILDGGGLGTVLYIYNDSSSDILVEGFTLRNGSNGGVSIHSESGKGHIPYIYLFNNIIQGNSGGGVSAYSYSNDGNGGPIALANNIITGNSGGGVAATTLSYSGWSGGVGLVNNTITDNTASHDGGGVYAKSTSYSGSAGEVSLINNTITGNTTTTNGGGIFLYSGDNTINCYNNIIWGNTASTSGGDIYYVTGTGTANGYNNDYTNMTGSWTNSDHNINTDPLFVGAGDSHLQVTSPCIDKGLNTAPGIPAQDFEGDNRIIDGNYDSTATVDMGADEFAPPVIKPISDASIDEGTPYTGPTPTLSHGSQPVTWSLVTGPSGMSIDSSTGVVSWANPTSSGSPHTIAIQATNIAGSDTKSWQLTVTPPPGVLSITPIDGLSSSGSEGGPFDPSSMDYVLENTGGVSIDWTASKTQVWVTLSATGGTLAAGANTTVTVTINSTANSLSAGTYNDTVTFTNTTNGNGNTTRGVALTVSASLNSHCVNDPTELRNALIAAETNGADDIIMVVQGAYTGHFTYDSSEGHSITLLGGYTAECAARVVDPVNTILDGGGTGGVLSFSNNNGGDISVEGFTIQHGLASGDAGGGVYAYSYSASGTAGQVTLLNNTITGNSAMSGGGVYAQSTSDYGTAGQVTLLNNSITGNTGNAAGGVYAVSTSSSGPVGQITLLNNTITGNSAGTDEGGGVYAWSYSDTGAAGTITITNNTITGNDAPYDGGGVFALSYSNLGAAGTITLTNNTITGNSADDGGGAYFQILDSAGGTVNCYNNIIWGNTASSGGGDIYFEGSGTFNGYNNNYTTMSGSWTHAASNINADPLFVDAGYWLDAGTPSDPSDDHWFPGDYHLTSASPCIDKGDNSAPELPATDFEGDPRTIGPAPDIGGDEFSVLPANGIIFGGCSLINKYQPSFQWRFTEIFKSFTIYFSTSDTDFTTKGIFIKKANIKGTKFSYTPSSGVWKKFFTVGWNGGTIRNIYWKVIGTRQDKSTVSSAVWSFSVDAPYPPPNDWLLTPIEGAQLHTATPPIFSFDTACNVKFRLEISSDINFSDPKKIKAFTYTIKDPNVTGALFKRLSSGQWKAVQKLIGTAGYFRIRAWDAIKRETSSVTRSFTITTP